MVAQRYRWDFIGLSSQAKPTKATSDKVTNGSTYYESDTSKLYVFYGNQWYEKTAPGGGGGTSDFDQLSNRPKYNGTTMTHETNIPEVVTYSNFTGTDGVAAGTAGLVPAPATTDAGKFLKADGTWDTAGGGGPTVVQTTGNSQTDVMSQDATTKLVYVDSNLNKINIRGTTGIDDSTGAGAIDIGSASFARGEGSVSIGKGSQIYSNGTYSVAIGNSAAANNNSRAVALGNAAEASNNNSVAIGTNAKTTRVGEVNVGANDSGRGYNNTNYRVIGGVHDGQDSHDAVTVSQVNGVIDAINTALSTNISHIGA